MCTLGVHKDFIKEHGSESDEAIFRYLAIEYGYGDNLADENAFLNYMKIEEPTRFIVAYLKKERGLSAWEVAQEVIKAKAGLDREERIKQEEKDFKSSISKVI